MKDKNDKFISYPTIQLKNKFLATINTHDVFVWAKGDNPRKCLIASIDLTESKRAVVAKDMKGEYFGPNNLPDHLSFVQGSLQYFVSVTGLKVEKGLYHLELADTTYRYEKRENERLLTYPHYSAYFYIPVKANSGESTDNVLLFNRQTKIDKFQEYKSGRSRQLSEILGAETEEDSEVIGVRLLDLSATGMAIIVNKREINLIAPEKKIGRGFLKFNGQVYFLENLKVAYEIKYVDPKAAAGDFLKVGLAFEKVHEQIQWALEKIFMEEML